MDVVTQWRLLTGTARPFLKQKVRDALARPGAVRRAMKQLPTSPDGLGTPRKGLAPMPSTAWLEMYLDDAAAFARRIKRGDVRAYGVEEYWLHQDEPESVDPRGVLEIARMHQWPAYAMAALRAQQQGNPEKARGWYLAFMDEVHRFMQIHHPFASPLWSVAMDSGIRAVNLLTAFDWFQQLGLADASNGAEISAAAADHAIVIEAMLETAGGMATSHLLGDLMGLIAVDLYAGRHPEHLPMLIRETMTQTLGDGMSFEASTGYHRQVVDILVTCKTLLSKAGVDLPEQWVDRVDLATADLRCLEDRGMPLIGDNDDGLVYKLTGFSASTSFLFDWAPAPRSSDAMCHFSDFGLTLYDREKYRLTARCGHLGQHGKGGHAHNDQNAITFQVGGVEIIPDPGSVWYAGDPAQRNRDRSIRAHATVRLNHGEQHQIPSGNGSSLWWMVPVVQTRIVDASADRWEGEVVYPFGVHRRTLLLHNDRVIGLDVIPQGAQGEVRFPLAPGTVIQRYEQSATFTHRGCQCRLSWKQPATARIANHEIRVASRFGFGEYADVFILEMPGHEITWTLELVADTP